MFFLGATTPRGIIHQKNRVVKFTTNYGNVSSSHPPNLTGRKFPAKFGLTLLLTLNSCQENFAINCNLIMATKSQHSLMYRKIPVFLKDMRGKAGLTQRELGKIISKPQSYIYNCETANRGVDITEFIMWSKGCGEDAKTAFVRLLKEL